MAIVALFAAAASVASEVGWRFQTDLITLQQWTTFRGEVLAKPNIKRAEFANQLVITVEAERAIYVFTQPKHPAHPAVIVRVMVENGGGSIVKRMGHFAGSEAAFVSWWHEFDPLDAAIPGQQKRTDERSATNHVLRSADRSLVTSRLGDRRGFLHPRPAKERLPLILSNTSVQAVD